MLPFIVKDYDIEKQYNIRFSNPYKITSYSLRWSNGCDCLSLYFEYIGSKQIQINKFYYNSESFISFLNENSFRERKNYGAIKTSSYTVEFHEFAESILYLSRSLWYEYPNKTEALIHHLDRLRMHIEVDQEQEEDIEAIIGDINQTLLGYQRRFVRQFDEQIHYFNRQLEEALEHNIELVPYVGNEDNCRIPACMPEEYRLIDNPELFELRVYSVGQANCSALIKYKDNLKKDYNVVVVFDFGLESRKRNSKLKEMINKIDENTTIIISHFDLDHINNIENFELYRTCRWLFPEHEPRTKQANLLYHDLIKTASQKSINGRQVFSYKAPYSLSNYLRINQNTDKHINDRKYQSTLANAQCIISSLCINNTNVLIPADALYRDFPDDVFNYRYDYVLIPHHGCKYGDPSSVDPYFDKIRAIVNNDVKGVVMCGKGGDRHGHANTTHLRWYNDVCAFSDAHFYLSKHVNDTTYTPTHTEFSNYFSISFD